MKSLATKQNSQSSTMPTLRQWTKERLTEQDFSFAVSAKKGTWDSLSHRLWQSKRDEAKKVVAAMIDWETWREFEGNDLPSFSAVKENKERISFVLDPTTLPNDSQIEPLKKVSLPDAVRRNGEFLSGVDKGIRVHAFEIERDELTEVTVNRFRNWLVRYKRALWEQYAKPGSRHTGIAAVKGYFANRGRLSYDATLRALAVRRLKMAGYTREESESRLGLGNKALMRPTNHWDKMPKRACEYIQERGGQLSLLLESGLQT
jgi:hypothetical protein